MSIEGGGGYYCDAAANGPVFKMTFVESNSPGCFSWLGTNAAAVPFVCECASVCVSLSSPFTVGGGGGPFHTVMNRVYIFMFCFFGGWAFSREHLKHKRG